MNLFPGSNAIGGRKLAEPRLIDPVEVQLAISLRLKVAILRNHDADYSSLRAEGTEASMIALKSISIFFLAGSLLLLVRPAAGFAPQNSDAAGGGGENGGGEGAPPPAPGRKI